PAKETSFFDGIDTTIPGIYRALKKTPPTAADAALAAIDREVKAAVQAFKWTDPSASVPALARALAATRSATKQLGGDPDVAYVLTLKERQIADAIHTCLGVSLTAIAQPAGTPEASGPFNAGPVAMAPVIPGQTFDVRTTFVDRSPVEAASVRVTL